MRRALSEAATAALAAGTVAWASFFNADPLSPWLVPIVLAWVVALVVKVLVSLPPRGRGKGPDFLLSYRGPQNWELERVRRTPAQDVRQGDGITSRPLSEFDVALGDLDHGQRAIIGVPNDESAMVPFSWREGKQRSYSKSLHLVHDHEPFKVVGIEWKSGDPVQT